METSDTSTDVKAAAHTSYLLIGAIGIGVVLRVWASTLGSNFDLLIWSRIAEITSTGGNVYTAVPPVLNYGPVWPEILAVLKWVDVLWIHNLHMTIAAFLTIIDVLIAVMLVRTAGYVAGIFFLLCPVSILITGYHSQVDNFAVLFALLSWNVLVTAPTESGHRRVVCAAFLMGLSLATKHLMLFFPVWVLFWPQRPVTQRVLFCVLAYVVLALTFVPFLTSWAAIDNINVNVIQYRGDTEAGVFSHLVSLVVHEQTMRWCAVVSPFCPSVLWLWALTMCLTGIIVARKVSGELLFVYLVALLAYSPSMAEQYTAIPMVAVALYWRRWQSWAYVVTASALLSSSPVNIGALPSVGAHTGWFRDTQLFTFQNTQMCMLLLLLSFCYASRQRTVAGALE